MAVLLALGLSLVLFEAGARLLLGEPKKPARHFWISSGALLRDECGAVRYPANSQLRTAAVYGEETAYDLRFQTNNLGYVADRDYRPRAKDGPRERRIAIVGDSFTAGFHGGGGSWVTWLEASLAAERPNVRLFNLGVSATGLTHFRTRLRCANALLDFDEILIAAISDDFTRAEWWPFEQGNTIHLCLPGEEEATCKARTPLIRVFGDASNPIDTSPQKKRAASPKAWFRDETHLGQTLLRLRGALAPERKTAALPYAQVLAGIRSDLPGLPITLLHLAEKSEVEAGRYRADAFHSEPLPSRDAGTQDTRLNRDGTNVSRAVERAGIRYVPALERCALSRDGFQRLDGHPNRAGYEELARCVRRLLLEDVAVR